MRTDKTRDTLHAMEQESIVLLKNDNGTLPLKKSGGSVALLGPLTDYVSVRVSSSSDASNLMRSTSSGTTCSSTRRTMACLRLPGSSSYLRGRMSSLTMLRAPSCGPTTSLGSALPSAQHRRRMSPWSW